MNDRQKVEQALEILKGEGYQIGLWVMDSLRGEKHCSIGFLSRSAFDVHGHLCSSIPLHYQGNAQEIMDAFLEAGNGNFGIDVVNGEMLLNPASSTATYQKLGRPVKRSGHYKRITLEIREDLLAKMDASGKTRREYIESMIEK